MATFPPCTRDLRWGDNSDIVLLLTPRSGSNSLAEGCPTSARTRVIASWGSQALSLTLLGPVEMKTNLGLPADSKGRGEIEKLGAEERIPMHITCSKAPLELQDAE